MNVSLTPTLEDYIKHKLAGGLYSSASEVVREGLRALQEKEQDMKIQHGLEQMQAGLGMTFDKNYVDHLKQRIQGRVSIKPNKV